MVRAFDAPVMLTTRTASQVASLLQGHTAKMHAGDPKRVESAIELCAPPPCPPQRYRALAIGWGWMGKGRA